MEQKKEEKPFDFSSVVAGVGFEPHDLRVMSPTSYRLLYPAILDCKYTDYFLICKFYLQKLQILFLHHEHRVPCRKHDRLLIKHLHDVLRHILLLDYKAEHVLIEPLICHDETSLVS